MTQDNNNNGRKSRAGLPLGNRFAELRMRYTIEEAASSGFAPLAPKGAALASWQAADPSFRSVADILASSAQTARKYLDVHGVAPVGLAHNEGSRGRPSPVYRVSDVQALADRLRAEEDALRAAAREAEAAKRAEKARRSAQRAAARAGGISGDDALQAAAQALASDASEGEGEGEARAA